MRTVVWDLGGVVVSNVQLIMLALAIALMVLISLIVYRTKIGKATRAVSFDKDAARLMGIDADMVISITFALGSALAAAGGMLVGFYYNRISPTMGSMYGLKAFVAAVVGGIGANRRSFGPLMSGVDHLRHTHDPARNAFTKGLPEHGAELADEQCGIDCQHNHQDAALVAIRRRR